MSETEREVEIQKLIKRVNELEGMVASLTESKEALEAITDTAEDSIFIKGIDFRYTFVNPAMERTLGMLASELIGKAPVEVFGEDEARIIASVDKPVLEGQTVNAKRTLRINGIERTFHTVQTPVFDSKGNIKAICGIVRDVTHLQRAEETIRESEERFRSLTSLSPVGIFQADAHGNGIYVNELICKFTGMKVEEHYGDGWARAIHPDEREEVYHVWHQTIKGESSFDIEFRFISQDEYRKTTWVSSNFSALIDQNENIIGFIGTLTDITERKRVEEALRKSEEKLRTYNEELRIERQALHQKNIALKEVLEQIEAGKDRLAGQIKANIDRIIIPIINGLSDKSSSDMDSYVRLLKSSLSDITSPFIGHLESEYSHLTLRQMEICNMVKSGMSCKEISASLNISVQTVLKQRTLIRKKLGLSNKKINLASYLHSMSKIKT
ncbi:MAG: PAS domain S-box protein [candidate division Zixibacteria bacterium]